MILLLHLNQFLLIFWVGITLNKLNAPLIWKDACKEKKSCEFKVVGRSTNQGFLYGTSDIHIKRLQDRISQTDYLINTSKPLEFCNKPDLLSIDGMEKIVVQLHRPLFSEFYNNNNQSESQNKSKEEKVPSMLAAEITAAAHTQYTRDLAIEQTNKLVIDVRRLQCESRKSTHNNIVLSAKYNGWYAATLLNLSFCAKLIIRGEQIQSKQYTPQNVTFSPRETV